MRGLTIHTLMKEQGLDHIDLLKMDIEGAELEMLGDPSAWIGKVEALALELHERLRPGCVRSFENAAKCFDGRRSRGEHVFLTRSGRSAAGA